MREQKKSYSMPIAFGIVFGGIFIIYLLYKFGIL